MTNHLTREAALGLGRRVVQPEDQPVTLPEDVIIFTDEEEPELTEENIKATATDIINVMKEEGHSIPSPLTQPDLEFPVIIRDENVAESARRTLRFVLRREALDVDIHPSISQELSVEEGLPLTVLFQAAWKYIILADVEINLKIASQKKRLRFELKSTEEDIFSIDTNHDKLKLRIPTNTEIKADLYFHALGEFFPGIKLGAEIFKNRKIIRYNPRLTGNVGDKTKPTARWKWAP